MQSGSIGGQPVISMVASCRGNLHQLIQRQLASRVELGIVRCSASGGRVRSVSCRRGQQEMSSINCQTSFTTSFSSPKFALTRPETNM
eukprot:jgi/Botrbrau1/2244/Bobra.101_2s0072.1